MIYVVGVDPGFASAPTGTALLAFGDTPILVGTRSLRPRCGGDWQHRVYDVLVQLRDWLSIEILPYYPPAALVLAYELAHLRELARAKGHEANGRGKRERPGGTHVLNPQTALRLESLGAGVRGLAVGYSLECIGVQSVQSKVALTGYSDADKAMMISAARQIFGHELSEHEADACGHALAAEAIWRRERLVRAAAVEARRQVTR